MSSSRLRPCTYSFQRGSRRLHIKTYFQS
uniref:Uncharacterized protein n=1 Tax=Anguilla anguilla TaxID=7936 RepID=A0A0E9PMP8_ANGAN